MVACNAHILFHILPLLFPPLVIPSNQYIFFLVGGGWILSSPDHISKYTQKKVGCGYVCVTFSIACLIMKRFAPLFLGWGVGKWELGRIKIPEAIHKGYQLFSK